MLSDEVKQLLDSAASLNPKGANIKLESNVLQARRTPLTFEELKKLISEGTPLPADKSLPSLTMQQYQELPGGLTAYQNLAGFGQQQAIEGTAGVNQPIDNADVGDDDEEVIEVNCPSGYVYNPQTKQCEPVMRFQDEENNIDVDDQLEASYNRFANFLFDSEDFKNSDGTYQDFLNAANESYLGKHWNFFFNDDSMMHNAYYTGVYMGGKGVGSSSMDQSDPNVDDFDFNTGVMPDVSEPDVSEPDQAGLFGDPGSKNENRDKTIIQSSSPATTPMSAVGNVNMGGSGIQDPSQIDRPAGGGAVFTSKFEPKSGGGSGASSVVPDRGTPFFANEGGFVEQTKPLQLSDVSLKMQEGGQIPVEQPVEGMPIPSGQPAGFIEDPSATPAPDNPVDALMGEGQEDDVMGKLPEGTFVINAMAVQLAGLDELDKMVEEAYESMIKNLREKGVEVPLITQLVERSKSVAKVDVAVSNGEYIIPPELVPIIGEDKLRKINDRGLKKLEETKKTREKQKSPVQMREGGTLIDTDSSGKIATKQIGTPDKPKSLILTKESVAPNMPKKKTKKATTTTTPFKRKVSPDEIAAGFTGDIPLTPLDTTEQAATLSTPNIQRKVSPDEMASGFMRRLEDEGSKISGPDTVIENTPAQVEGMKLSGPDTVVDYTQPTFGGGEGQLAPTRRKFTGGEGTRELTQGFIRPTETGKGRKIQSDTMNTADGFIQSSVKMDEEYLKNLYAAYEKQVKDGNVEGLNVISEGGSIFASAPVNVKMEFSKLVQNDLAEIAAGKTYSNLNSQEKNAKESKLEKNRESLIDKFLRVIKKPFQQLNREPLSSIKKNNNEVMDANIDEDVDGEIFNYNYNTIKDAFDELNLSKNKSGFKMPSFISTAQADEAQGAALSDPDYVITSDMKINPNKMLNIPHFIHLIHSLGRHENTQQELRKDSYTGTAGGLFQLQFNTFAPKELIDQKNVERKKKGLKLIKMGDFTETPGVYRAETIEEFYNPRYQMNMAIHIMRKYLEDYDGNPVQAIVAYNAGPGRADKLGPNNDFDALNEHIYSNRVSAEKIAQGDRIMRDALRLVNGILPEFGFQNFKYGKDFAKVSQQIKKAEKDNIRVNIPQPVPKPKRVGGFV